MKQKRIGVVGVLFLSVIVSVLPVPVPNTMGHAHGGMLTVKILGIIAIFLKISTKKLFLTKRLKFLLIGLKNGIILCQ